MGSAVSTSSSLNVALLESQVYSEPAGSAVPGKAPGGARWTVLADRGPMQVVVTPRGASPIIVRRDRAIGTWTVEAGEACTWRTKTSREMADLLAELTAGSPTASLQVRTPKGDVLSDHCLSFDGATATIKRHKLEAAIVPILERPDHAGG